MTSRDIAIDAASDDCSLSDYGSVSASMNPFEFDRLSGADLLDDDRDEYGGGSGAVGRSGGRGGGRGGGRRGGGRGGGRDGGSGGDPGDHAGVGDAAALLHALQSREPLRGVTAISLLEVLTLLSDKWLVPLTDVSSCWGSICERLGLDPTTVHTPSEVDVAAAREIVGLMELFKYMDASVYDGDANPAEVMTSMQTPVGISRRETLSRIAQVIHMSHKAQLYMSGALSVADDSVFPTLGWEETVVSLFNDDSQRPHQIVLLHVLDLLSQPHVMYRKSGDSCYGEITSPATEAAPDGYATHAFEKKCTILEFIFSNITVENNYPMWCLMTQGSLETPAHVSKFLEESVQYKFPELKRNRHLFAFNNGLFDTEQIAFYPFADRSGWDEIASAATGRLRSHYPNFTASAPLRSAVATNYFAVDFDASALNSVGDIMDIDPSAICCDDAYKIVLDQTMDEESILWFFVFLGRLMYDTGTHDNWQLIFFLKGVAGCGKSTFVSFMRYVIGLSRVGVMASNAETKFALGPLYQMDMVACLETKRDFAIPQSDIQSMASGEALSIAMKYKPAETVTWTAPLFFVGNELPDWRDASGSMARRLMLFVFRKRITDVDTELFTRMQTNTALFLLRIIVSYRQAVVLYGKIGIWGRRSDGEYILPAQLRKFRDDMVHAVQPLMNYLNRSGQFINCRDFFNKEPTDFYIPETVVRDGFRKWCKDSSIDCPPWNEDLWHVTFEDAGIERRHEARDWEGDLVNDFFLFGIGLAV